MFPAWMRAAGVDEGAWDRLPRAPRFPLALPICYVVLSTGAWGTGVTQDVSRTGVRFHPDEPNLRAGDIVRFVMVLPGAAGEIGAIASCRGQVIRTGPGLAALAIETQQLLSERAARADLQQSPDRRLIDWWEGAEPFRLQH